MEGQPEIDPQEQARIQKERTLSDAELLKQGGEYVFDNKGNPVLKVKPEQIDKLREEKEKGEIAADLGTYIKMHNEIVLSHDDPELAEVRQAIKSANISVKAPDIMPGEYFLAMNPSGSDYENGNFKLGDEIYYFNKDGGISRTVIDNTKVSGYEDFLTKIRRVSALGGTGGEIKRYRAHYQNDLKALGFTRFDEEGGNNGYNYQEAFKKATEIALVHKKERLEKESLQQKKREFDF